MELGIVIGSLTIVLGLVSLFFVNRSLHYFPPESEIKAFVRDYLLILIFILFFSIWNTFKDYYRWREEIGEFMQYPEYFFISATYSMIFLASYKGYRLAKQFGLIKNE